MFANDLDDQITGMEKVLSEFKTASRSATEESGRSAIPVKRNTQAILQLAAEKSRQARRRVVAAITAMQSQGTPINFNTICRTARVSKTFLYDPKHSDLAEQIRSLRQLDPQSTTVQLDKSKQKRFSQRCTNRPIERTHQRA